MLNPEKPGSRGGFTCSCRYLLRIRTLNLDPGPFGHGTEPASGAAGAHSNESEDKSLKYEEASEKCFYGRGV